MVDVEAMFKLLNEDSDIKDAPGAQPLTLTKGPTVEFDQVGDSGHPKP